MMVEVKGFVDTSDSIPWRDAFAEYENEDMPGVCLSAARGGKVLPKKRSPKDRHSPEAYFRNKTREKTHRQGEREKTG